jgi:hypothetical protein
MSLPIEFQNDQFNITETATGITIAIGRELTGYPEVQESIRQLMMVALKFLLTEDLAREKRQDAEDRESDIREAVRSSMETRTDEGASESVSDESEAHELEVDETEVHETEVHETEVGGTEVDGTEVRQMESRDEGEEEGEGERAAEGS